MKSSARITAPLIKFILRRLCRVSFPDEKTLPLKGPYIFAMNHINFLEVPLIFTHLFPRPVKGLVKHETWKNKFLGFLGESWEAIPIDRKGPSISTMRKVKEVLDKGEMLLIAPEGTRSKDGSLRQGAPGIVSIAMHSDARIIPIAHFGGEKIWLNIKSFRRTRFTIKTGPPFRIKKEMVRTASNRQEAVDEIMIRIAGLLPHHMRGVYKEREVTDKYISYTGGRGN